MLMTRIATLQK